MNRDEVGGLRGPDAEVHPITHVAAFTRQEVGLNDQPLEELGGGLPNTQPNRRGDEIDIEAKAEQISLEPDSLIPCHGDEIPVGAEVGEALPRLRIQVGGDVPDLFVLGRNWVAEMTPHGPMILSALDRRPERRREH